MRPLDGLKVVELARILAGPWAGQILADLGAEVVKVEAPEGDDTRQWGPPFIDREGDRSAAYFHAANRGKRSVIADFRTPEGQAAVRALVADADVVIENYKVGGLARYGLDHAGLSADHPRLITCSITGFKRSHGHAPTSRVVAETVPAWCASTASVQRPRSGGSVGACAAITATLEDASVRATSTRVIVPP